MSLESKAKEVREYWQDPFDSEYNWSTKIVPLEEAQKALEVNNKNWAIMFADQEKRHDARAKELAQLEAKIAEANKKLDAELAEWERVASIEANPLQDEAVYSLKRIREALK